MTGPVLSYREAGVLARLLVGPVWRRPEDVAAECGWGLRAASAAQIRLVRKGLAVRRVDRTARKREQTLWAARERA